MFTIISGILLVLNCYLTVATNKPDVELRIANMEKVLLERISNLENIVNNKQNEISQLKQEANNQRNEILQFKLEAKNQKNEISLLKQEVAHLLSRGRQTENKTMILKNLILHKKILQNEASPHTKRNANHSVNRDRRILIDNVNNSQRIAFYAFMRANEPIQKHKTVIFDVTKTNFGNGYNNNTGIFIAPGSGVYVLTFTAHADTASYASLEIVVNNEVEGTAFIDNSSSDWDMTGSTALVVVWMNQGDVTFVRSNPSYDSAGTLYSSYVARCSFAGWKISD